MTKKFITIEEDSVKKYLKEIKNSSPLTKKEEAILAEKIKNGDEKAINVLIKSNLKFVITIAKEYQGNGLPLSDLINEGNYGLIKAAYKFDYTKGFRFISYAVWWVRQSIIQSLNDNARTVRLPNNIINKISLMNKEMNKIKIFDEVEIEPSNYNKLSLYINTKNVSLSDIINEDGDEMVNLFSENLYNDDNHETDEVIKEELVKTLETLNDREKVIVESYFGLNEAKEPMTLEAIGEKYSLTKERVRQIKEKSIRKLRDNSLGLFKIHKSDAFLF